MLDVAYGTGLLRRVNVNTSNNNSTNAYKQPNAIAVAAAGAEATGASATKTCNTSKKAWQVIVTRFHTKSAQAMRVSGTQTK